MSGTTPTFAQQRLICLALLSGIAMYMVAVAFLLQNRGGNGLGDGRLEMLDQVSIFAGIGLAIAAFVVRFVMRGHAENAPPEERSAKRFAATLTSLAMLEGGCLFGITTWMLNGNAVPGLVVALVLFALAIVVVPFSVPDGRPDRFR